MVIIIVTSKLHTFGSSYDTFEIDPEPDPHFRFFCEHEAMSQMNFDKFHEMTFKIGKDRTLSKKFGCLLENVGCILVAVVIMTTASGMHPTFSRRHPKWSFIIYDLTVITEFAEVHTDIARIIVKSSRPLLP